MKASAVFTVDLTFLEPVLGTVAKDPEVFASYIAAKAEDAEAEEIETAKDLEHMEAKGWTGFHPAVCPRPVGCKRQLGRWLECHQHELTATDLVRATLLP